MDRIIFANIGWMEHYQGNNASDIIEGGGSRENLDKYEAFNFQVIDGKCFGYVRTVRGSKIRLSRIDKSIPANAEKLTNVIVVWVAKDPNFGGTYIVGWYNNATVYADRQPSDNPKRNKYGYYFTADEVDCNLLEIEARSHHVPRATQSKLGFLGQSNVWYADSDNPLVKKFRKVVLEYIKCSSYSKPQSFPKINVF